MHGLERERECSLACGQKKAGIFRGLQNLLFIFALPYVRTPSNFTFLLNQIFGLDPAHLRKTVRLSVPVVIGQLGIILTGVIDNMMVGWVSHEHLSASSLANALYFILVVISMGITNAIAPLVAESDAAENHDKSSAVLRQSVWLAVISSVVTMMLMEGSIHLMPYLRQPEGDVLLGSSYLRWVYLSVPPMILFLTYKGYTDGLSQTRIAMIVTLAGLVFNALANWALIFGRWGFPRWELDGAGVATLASRIFMLALVVLFVHLAKSGSRLSLSTGSWKPDWRVMRRILGIGLPSGFQLFFEVGAFAGAVIIIGQIGPEARSAHQIVLNLASITYMVVVGISAGASIRVGNAIGRNDLKEARLAGNAGLFLGASFMSLSAIVFLFGKDLFPTWYNDHPEVLQISSELMLFASVFQISDGLQAVGLGILRGLQDVVIPMLIAFVCYWLIALPLGYVSTFHLEMGPKGMWVGFVVSLTIAAISFWIRFKRLTRPGLS